MSAPRHVLHAVAIVIAGVATVSAQPTGGGTPPTPPADDADDDPPDQPVDQAAAPVSPENERCALALDALRPDRNTALRADGCRRLTEHVRDELENQQQRARKKPGAAAEPTLTDTVNGQDSAAQTSAVASGAPVPQAGGTVALAGVPGTGLQMVTALAVNPLGLAAGEDEDGKEDGEIDPEKWKSYAWASRFADVAVILPIDLDAAGAVEKGFQYYGLRARVNVATLIWDPQDNADAVEAAFKTSFALSADYVGKVRQLLESSQQPGECAEALIADDHDAQIASCGEAVDREADEAAYLEARRALDRFREDSDRKYAALELRLDRGDVNGDAAPSRDTLLAGYLSFGYRLVNTKRILAFRARTGVGYFKDGLTQTDRTVLFIAGGLELALLRDQGKFVLTAGYEAQRIEDDDDMTDPANTDFTNIRVGIGVPLADGKQLSIGLAFPDDFETEPQLTVSGDWALLFGD